MRIIKKTIEIIELDEAETELLKELLGYCHHRARHHKTPISRYADKIEQFRQDLRLISEN